jgi:hypothetical protein
LWGRASACGELGLSADPLSTIRDADFVFENMVVKIVANRNSPGIDIPGVKVGPFREGKEYEVRFWIAKELKKAGIAHIRMDEPLDLMILNKIHWKERVQSSQRVTSLPEEFYPKLRRYLEELNEEGIKKPEKRSDYEKAKNLSDDITQMRLKKIVSLASSPAQTRQILGSLTKEEKYVYDCLHKIISEWKTEILKPRGGGKT